MEFVKVCMECGNEFSTNKLYERSMSNTINIDAKQARNEKEYKIELIC